MTNNIKKKPNRRYDIDCLRVLAVLLLFFYHPARIFYQWGGWYIQNSEGSRGISLIALFVEHWHMPLFFALAGASTYFALRFRSGRKYVGERFKRLLVPFNFGLLVLVPPQIYLDLLHNNVFSSAAVSYWQFYPDFFTSRYTGSFDMGHLWFIAYLFIFSLISLSLFLFLTRQTGQKLVGWLAGFLSRPGMIFLPVIVVMVADYVLLHFYPNPLYYLVFFIYGYILMADERFEQAVANHKTIALVLGLGLYVAWISLVTTGILNPEWLQPIPRDLIGWCCLIALFGYGKQFLGFSNRFLKYAGEGSYPVYILHQTIIIFIAYFVVQWNLGALIKFTIIVVTSLTATALVYDLLVKRFNLIRFVFGMRPKRKPATAAMSVAAPAQE